MSGAYPSQDPPNWPYCGTEADAAAPLGCRGIRVDGHDVCLGHLAEAERAEHLAGLGPEADLDLRGVVVTAHLLSEILDAVREPADGEPTFGTLECMRARFPQGADFTGARFLRQANFSYGRFSGVADFSRASFEDHAYFNETEFAGAATFNRAAFGADTQFVQASFGADAQFIVASFAGDVMFFGATCQGRMDFGSAVFRGTQRLGPLACAGRVSLFRASFALQTNLTISAAEIDCTRARFEGTATLRARYAELDLSGSEFARPFTVRTEWATDELPMESTLADGRTPMAKVVSLAGVDAAQLLLSDVDLSRCRFAGAHHPDQIRREGVWRFGAPPTGVHWRLGIPHWWSRRMVLAEERSWRSLPSRPYAARRDWTERDEEPGEAPGLATLTSLYRQLRKSFEDAKDEPGAADFYYGEMEMRRHSAVLSRGERFLLHLYWAFSGYGMRASRALAWFGAAATATVVLMMGLGLPDASPHQTATGFVPPVGSRISLDVDTEEPELTLPFGDRFTSDRLDKSLRVVLNSVVFRSSGQNLTAWGTYTEMAARFSEPILLGLAALAVRGRVKRG